MLRFLRRISGLQLRDSGCASQGHLTYSLTEGVIMKIGGWRTRSVFERYAIVSRTDSFRLPRLRRTHNFRVLPCSSISCRYTR